MSGPSPVPLSPESVAPLASLPVVRRHAFTVDVEDYFQVSAFEGHIDRAAWGSYPSRVVANTRKLLALLQRHSVRGTFFVLGWVAERFPHLVREIQAGGHELGSHGYGHQTVYRLSPDEFRADLIRAKRALEEILGAAVTAYRAPSFSITQKSLWALPILAEEGFRYDSSIFPIYRRRYGIADAQPLIHPIDTPAGRLWEFPMSVAGFGRWNLPVGGGGYFRLYPLSWTLRLLSRVDRTHDRPFVFYLHPWELDPEQPRLRAGTRLSHLRHYVHLRSTAAKLERLLGHFSFAPLSEVIKEAIHNGATGSVVQVGGT